MENEKPNESQELTIQELASIAGGVAVGEPYPTEPYPGQYPTGDIYKNVSETIAKQLENIKLPEWKHNYSHTSSSESSTEG
ncbi:MAG: hypothetical protein RMY34_29720 [Aulosira sp. DedQUE10]|nr:hypothetical protein [Aulosira sp. DedQUE10]